VENEVEWRLNMLIMVYFNKICGNVISEQFLDDNLTATSR
jgi:hypothetical protein